MRPVKLIDAGIVSLLAASEIIQNAASVVKELVENAIDAGADDIRISVAQGGNSLIQVMDNGSGMSSQDLRLCLQAHTSSKTYTREEAISPDALGFRGEALHSIASVSDVRITSWNRSDETGWELRSESAAVVLKPAPRIKGTTVTVTNLFRAIPARQMALPQPAASAAAITRLIRDFIIARPEIRLRLTVDQKLRLDSHDISEKAILGASTRVVKFRTVLQQAAYSVELSVTDCQEGRRPASLTTVDGRIIDHPGFSRAIHNAFRQVRGGAKPRLCYILTIRTAPHARHLLNVHIHPQKLSVGFRDGMDVAAEFSNALVRHLRTDLRNALQDGIGAIGKLPSSGTDERDLPLGRPVAQFNNSWIIAERRGELLIIDQHAAHERVVMERMRDQQQGAPIESRPIAKTLVCSGDHELTETLADTATALGRAGFEFVFDQAQGAAWLTAVPSFTGADVNWSDFFNELVDEGETLGSKLEADILDLPTRACRRAVKFGHALSTEQMRWLLREMELTPSALYCNHGRPTVKKLSDDALRELFGRLP